MADFDADPSSGPDLTVIHESPCRHLRSKGMYVFTDRSPEDGYGDDDNTIYWCMHTMKSFGPDEDMVDRRGCRNPGRSCYEPV